MTPTNFMTNMRGRKALAWCIAALSVAMVSVGAWLAYRNNLIGLPIAVRQFVKFYLDELPAAQWAIMGALIISYKPRHANGWLMCALGFIWSAKLFAGEYAIHSYFGLPSPAPLAAMASWVVTWGWAAGFVPLCGLLFTLPTGQAVSVRWRIPMLITVLCLAGIVLVQAALFWPIRGRDILTLTGADLSALAGPMEKAFQIVTPIGLLLCAVSMLLRLRRAQAAERQQLKWLAFAVVFYVGFLALSTLLEAAGFRWITGGLSGDIVSMLLAMVIPSAIGIAIARHKLFDIDVIIRKTLQWTVVTVLLGAVYVLSVLGLQEVFKRVTGQTSEVAVALSTLALAVAFMPIRRAAQNLIDKRFYRKRYNAQQVVEAYAESIKDEVDVNVIHQKMLTVLGETLQPKKITLFLVTQAKGEGGKS